MSHKQHEATQSCGPLRSIIIITRGILQTAFLNPKSQIQIPNQHVSPPHPARVGKKNACPKTSNIKHRQQGLPTVVTNGCLRPSSWRHLHRSYHRMPTSGPSQPSRPRAIQACGHSGRTRCQACSRINWANGWRTDAELPAASCTTMDEMGQNTYHCSQCFQGSVDRTCLATKRAALIDPSGGHWRYCLLAKAFHPVSEFTGPGAPGKCERCKTRAKALREAAKRRKADSTGGTADGDWLLGADDPSRERNVDAVEQAQSRRQKLPALDPSSGANSLPLGSARRDGGVFLLPL